MFNLNINLTIKADQMPQENAAYVAAFVEALAERGYHFSPESVKPARSPAIAQEKGPNEIRFLEVKGLKRMKVPTSWQGSREEYAAFAISEQNSEQDANEQDADGDPLSVLHE